MLMARRTRAVAYAAAGRHDLAIADIRALEKISELTPEDEIVLGDNLRFAGRYSEAARVLERAVAGSPKFAQPLISLAEVRIAEKQVRRGRGDSASARSSWSPIRSRRFAGSAISRCCGRTWTPPAHATRASSSSIRPTSPR